MPPSPLRTLSLPASSTVVQRCPRIVAFPLAVWVQNTAVVAEHVRTALRRQLCHGLADGDRRAETDGPARALRSEAAEMLRAEVAAMNPDANFVVRPKRRLVERFATAEAWQTLDDAARAELAAEVAGLPSERAAEKEEAKRFDLLMLNLQLCVLDAAPGFDRFKRRVMELAAALEAQSGIPAIREHLEALQELQADEWWEGVTAGLLETMRKRLRGVVHLIEKGRASIVYTDFADEEGEAAEVAFGQFEGRAPLSGSAKRPGTSLRRTRISSRSASCG